MELRAFLISREAQDGDLFVDGDSFLQSGSCRSSQKKRHVYFRIFSLYSCAPFYFLAFFVPLMSLRAQVHVDLSLERNLYIAYEPLLVSIALMNMSGRDLKLESMGSQSWLGFNIRTAEGRWLAPHDMSEPSLTLPAGSTLRRTINITPLFPLGELGAYEIAATVFQSDLNRNFRSSPMRFEITEGSPFSWQEVGVPGSTETRLISFLLHRVTQSTALYLRIADIRKGVIYCTHQLGGLVAYSKPEIAIDRNHSIHVLQSSAPRRFIYTAVNLDGKVLDRRLYFETGSRLMLRKIPDGAVRVTDGHAYLPIQFAEDSVETNISPQEQETLRKM
ncbi:MAG: hypothetical protein C5B47_08385 [Verrucomicrobia bacterium]|nr:MAG: hypothetical protein C5B47_08385 [Verrucomicrobiota bacterium]